MRRRHRRGAAAPIKFPQVAAQRYAGREGRARALVAAWGASCASSCIRARGGVGKTTVAAATAVRCAELGYRTVVLSTDLAHSLADSFDRPLAPEPVEIAPNLWAQE